MTIDQPDGATTGDTSPSVGEEDDAMPGPRAERDRTTGKTSLSFGEEDHSMARPPAELNRQERDLKLLGLSDSLSRRYS